MFNLFRRALYFSLLKFLNDISWDLSGFLIHSFQENAVFPGKESPCGKMQDREKDIDRFVKSPKL